MSAAGILQEAIVQTVRSVEGLSGVFDGPPARVEFPYVVVDCSGERDWSLKLREGREIDVRLTLWDHPGPRLIELEEALLDCALASRDLPAWFVSSLVFFERKRVRSPEGVWASHLTLRARLLQA